MKELVRLDNGTADMKDAALSVGGIATDEAQAQSIRAALRASVPTAFTLVDQIKAREMKAPEPAPAAPAPPQPSQKTEPAPQAAPDLRRRLHQRHPRRSRLRRRKLHPHRSLRLSPRPNKSPPRPPRRRPRPSRHLRQRLHRPLPRSRSHLRLNRLLNPLPNKPCQPRRANPSRHPRRRLRRLRLLRCRRKSRMSGQPEQDHQRRPHQLRHQ